MPLDFTKTQNKLLAILFAAGDPVNVAQLSKAAELSAKETKKELNFIKDAFQENEFGIRLIQVEDSFQLCSASEFADTITAALGTRKPAKLSQSQLEVLTIIAYYQPITKVRVDELRDVDSAYAINSLLTKHLIREAGRLETIGRPFMYETTEEFLRIFGLESLNELPPLDGSAPQDNANPNDVAAPPVTDVPASDAAIATPQGGEELFAPTLEI